VATKRKARNFVAKRMKANQPKSTKTLITTARKAKSVRRVDSKDVQGKDVTSVHAETLGTLQYPFSPYTVIAAEVAHIKERATPEDAQIVRDNTLLGHRDEIACILEKHWPEIGWQLEVLRKPGKDHKPESLRSAFEPLRGCDREFLFNPFLRLASVPSTGLQVRKTLKELAEQRKRLAALREPIEAQNQKWEEKRRAVQQASKENREELGKEIVRRRGVLLQLQDECQACAELISNPGKKFHSNPTETSVSDGNLADTPARYARLKDQIETEERIIRDLKKNYDNATPQNWAWAKEVAEKHEAKLSTLKTREKEIREEIVKLEDRYGDQGAGFARKDLFTFIAQHRCRHTPRQLARAIAGLPDMSCRDSFELCRRFPSKRDPHKNYEVFQVIARAWARRDRTSPDPHKRMQLFQEEIERIPRMRPYNNERVPNYIRKFFEDNKKEVDRAINSHLKPHPEPERIPYLITAQLLKNIDDRFKAEARKTDLERVLAERTREGQ